jgi:hypothetical protein
VGFSLESFKDLLGPNSADVTAISDVANDDHIPARSGQVAISTAIIALSNPLSPIIVASNGYPAFAMLDHEFETKLTADLALPTGAAQTIFVENASAFPIAGSYNIRIGDEWVHVTRVSTFSFITTADVDCDLPLGRQCDDALDNMPAVAHVVEELVQGGQASLNVKIDPTTGRPIPDHTKWIRGDPVAAGPAAHFDDGTFEPLLDLNGDGEPDNFDFLGTGRMQQISLAGTDIPSMDMDGDGVLDLDINLDGIPDLVQDDGQGNLVYFMLDGAGNPEPVSDQGLAIGAWNANSTQLTASWPMPTSTNSLTGYQMAVGKSFTEEDSLSFGWKYIGAATSGTVSGLALPIPKVTRLKQPLTPTDTSIFVEDANNIFERGKIVIGSEIIGVQRVNSTEFTVITGEKGCPAGSGRGCSGSLPQVHLPGELVSDQMVLVSVRGFTGSIVNPTDYIPSEKGRPILVYRVDPTAPTPPGKTVAQVPTGKAAGGSFVVSWGAAEDSESGVMAYEVQERTDTNLVWNSIAMIPAQKVGGVINNSYNVGNPVQNPTEELRKNGQFLTYRIRSYSFSGLPSAWSTESLAVATSLSEDVITNVSNYPNPFDSRKGGPEGRTVITYTLGVSADVEIVIYDLLGYVVKSFNFSPGEPGGRQGANFVEWDGHNGMGQAVAKGGYIARIKVGSSLGTATLIRKIGVIH